MPEPECPGCRELRRRVAELEALVRELQARLGINASNSSLPPSANPPGAPKPVIKAPTGRKPGGQPGHQAHLRMRLPRERLKETVHLIPKVCSACQAPLSAQAGARDPEPAWHQVAELPATLAEVTEYQAHGRRCRRCGIVTWEKIPDDLRAHAFGPRLTAMVAYLSGSPHVSKRGIEELIETLVGIPIALGTVANMEQEVSAALAPAHAEAQQAVRQAAIKHVDETGWKQAGQPCWLWAAASALTACFVIHPRRGALGLAALLGNKIKGIVCSDRWSAYGRLKIHRRQVCWAHLKRDFQKLVDRGGAAKELGEFGLAMTGIVFDVWHTFRGGGLSRSEMQSEMAEWRATLRDQLRRGCAGADSKAAAFCQNVLAVEPALWTFVDKPQVQPTNNHIERILRSAVLWRKNAFGCHSAKGCRFVERILTVVQTLRLQERPVLDFLHRAVFAHRHARRAPKLLPSG
jgi:Transposase IS66 family.